MLGVLLLGFALWTLGAAQQLLDVVTPMVDWPLSSEGLVLARRYAGYRVSQPVAVSLPSYLRTRLLSLVVVGPLAVGGLVALLVQWKAEKNRR